MKTIKEILLNQEIQTIMDWDLHPYDAVARYLEWGSNWSRGIDHLKSCNEEAAYFKINAIKKPAILQLVRQSHKNFEKISEIEAPQEMIDRAVKYYACDNATCGITDELRDWLKREASPDNRI